MLKGEDDSVRYQELRSPPATPDWLELTAEVAVPVGTKQISVQHVLATEGTLQIDDVLLARDTAPPFKRALVSLTFDDSWASDAEVVFPLLKKYGVPATHYVITNLVGKRNRLTWKQLAMMHAAGEEIAPHTLTHPDLITIAPEQLVDELDEPKQALLAHCLGTAENFASPFGSYDEATLAAIRTRYGSHRTTSGRFNTPSTFSPYELRAQGMRPTTTAEDVGRWVDEALAQNKWLILVYHAVEQPASTEYAVTPANFEAQLRTIVEKKIAVVTIAQALAEIRER
jgi:peptidoglycan/xylan/chitin deacetylase (PgdA/CDA1 family)